MRRSTKLNCCVLTLAILWPGNLQAEDWPRFRGLTGLMGTMAGLTTLMLASF